MSNKEAKEVGEIIRSIMEVKILEALNSAPELIEKLALAAIHEEVNERGETNRYDSKIPYLTYLMKEEVRHAAKDALRQILKEKLPELKEMIKKNISLDSISEVICKNILKCSEERYGISVYFKAEP